MPILALILLVGVLVFMAWRRRTSSLTRNCRWRRQGADGLWRCAFCGAEVSQDDAPQHCRNPRQIGAD